MHIQAVNTEPVAPSRLLQQLREASTDVVPSANPSVEVSLSPDARLTSLVDRLLAGEGPAVDAGRVVRLLGQSPLFEQGAGVGATGSQGISPAAPGIADIPSASAVALQDIGRGGFDAGRLLNLLQSTPEALPLIQASIGRAGSNALFDTAANDSSALPPTIRLYLDNGGVPGAQLEPPRPPEVTPLNPLP